ncbi:MAG: M48 family metalloprotease [FCB group bacterium]|nr:M48 family metalloprotease [FCB group bacterium]
MLSGRRSSAVLSLIVFFGLFLSCATTGPGGKKSFILISDKQEISIGNEMDRQIRETEKILPDAGWQYYINEIGQKIVAVSDRRGLEFHFAVVESDQINAFATPGGYIYIYTGLLKKINRESELVAVIAHEISHVVGRHGVKRLQTILGASLVLDLALGEKSETTKNIAGAALGVVMSGYSRSQEYEADEFGLIYMNRAGWNPQGMTGMFELLQSISGHRDAGFFEMLSSSHPQTSDRITAVNNLIPSLPRIPNQVLDSRKFQQMKNKLP